jgi:hypothetical protein
VISEQSGMLSGVRGCRLRSLSAKRSSPNNPPRQ